MGHCEGRRETATSFVHHPIPLHANMVMLSVQCTIAPCKQAQRQRSTPNVYAASMPPYNSPSSLCYDSLSTTTAQQDRRPRSAEPPLSPSAGRDGYKIHCPVVVLLSLQAKCRHPTGRTSSSFGRAACRSANPPADVVLVVPRRARLAPKPS